MATSTLRFAIIVALIAGGILLIGQAFPEGSNTALSNGGRTGTPAETESVTPTTGAKGGGGQQTGTNPPPIEGVKVAVYNGTFVTGLAAATADRLERLGYKINPETSILDAESKPVDVTTIYFVTADDKPAAEALADGFFKKKGVEAKVAKLPADSAAPAGVQLAVYIGTDYPTPTT